MLGLGFVGKIGLKAAQGLLKAGSFMIENKEIVMLVVPGLQPYSIAFSGANAVIDYFDQKDEMTNEQKQIEAATALSMLVHSATGREVGPGELLEVVNDLVKLKRELDTRD